jgi:folate-dependent phosphoribosylglycinamide formyltransferase PurN
LSPSEHKSFFKFCDNSPVPVALFVSGTGTNAEKILTDWQERSDSLSYQPVCIVTDRPKRCRAPELAKRFGVDLISLDIFDFYKERGQSTTSLASERGREIRDEWTDALYDLLKSYEISFGVFAGFIPLTNITQYFPCLNVHPGDLTVCNDDDERLLIGLHTLPIHLAVQHEMTTLRSSVIVAGVYEDGGSGMDEGHILGVSEEVEIDWCGQTREHYLEQFSSRPEKKPAGGWQDDYQKFLEKNQERLKSNGDWLVLPSVVADFAAGKFAYQRERLFYKSGRAWLPIELIEYGSSGKEILFFNKVLD